MFSNVSKEMLRLTIHLRALTRWIQLTLTTMTRELMLNSRKLIRDCCQLQSSTYYFSLLFINNQIRSNKESVAPPCLNQHCLLLYYFFNLHTPERTFIQDQSSLNFYFSRLLRINHCKRNWSRDRRLLLRVLYRAQSLLLHVRFCRTL